MAIAYINGKRLYSVRACGKTSFKFFAMLDKDIAEFAILGSAILNYSKLG